MSIEDGSYDGDVESLGGDISISDAPSEMELSDYGTGPASNHRKIAMPDVEAPPSGISITPEEEEDHQESEEELLLEAVHTFFGDFDWDLPDDPEFMKRMKD